MSMEERLISAVYVAKWCNVASFWDDVARLLCAGVTPERFDMTQLVASR